MPVSSDVITSTVNRYILIELLDAKLVRNCCQNEKEFAFVHHNFEVLFSFIETFKQIKSLDW